LKVALCRCVDILSIQIDDDKMPHSSLVAAERAAIEGTGGGGGDLDTQQCHALQNELLSVSARICGHIGLPGES
jgi:hypothetical protein